MKNSFIRVLGSAEILRPQAGVASLKATIRCSGAGRSRWASAIAGLADQKTEQTHGRPASWRGRRFKEPCSSRTRWLVARGRGASER